MRVHRGFAAAWTVLVVALASCAAEIDQGDSAPALAKSEAALIETSISASPNPCITANGAGACTTTVTASSAYGASQQIWIGLDGAPPTYFSCLASGGSEQAPWIQPDHEYRFSLHPSASCDAAARGPEAGAVIVQGHRARITASQNPCSAAAGATCAPSIGWQSGYTAAKHQLWLAGGSAPLICAGKVRSGSARAITAGTTQQYELYTATDCLASGRGTLVATLAVRALAGFAVQKGNQLQVDGATYAQAGMNKHELIEQRLGLEFGSYTQDLQDASNLGIRVIRMRGAPFWPIGLAEWKSPATRAAYWAKIDDIVNAASSRNIKLIPTVLWNWFVFADLCPESLHATFALGQPSCGRDYLYQYTDELVARYASNSTILFWELTNEMNLGADVEFPPNYTIATHLGTPAQRSAADRFSTDELVGLLRALAKRIHAADPNHLVSSGYAEPRPAAMHLRTNQTWTADNESEMRAYIALTHPAPIDIVSVHMYDAVPNDRFGAIGKYNPDLLENYAAAADAIGKPLHLGEHGDIAPFVSVEPRGNFSRRMLLEALDLRLPVATTWTWKRFWDASTPDPLSIHPGSSPAMDALIAFHATVNGWRATAPAARSLPLGIVNPGFETDADADGLPDGWTVTGDPGSVAYASGAEIFDGKTLRLQLAGSGAVIRSNLVSVTPGKKLIVSAAVRPDLTGGGAAAVFGIEEFYSGGVRASVSPLTTDPAGFTVSAFQTKLTSTATSVRVMIYTLGGGKLLVDDVRISQL